jgi:DNA repair exonuclease SbcCD ATPase subunit
MGDDSSRSIVKSLKNEWALFWEAFHGEEVTEETKDAFESGKLEVLSLSQVREITKALIEDRKRLNQKLETLSKEIDLNSAKLESLRLVGGEEDETLKRIHELNDLGQSMATAMEKLDSQLRAVRDKEVEIQEEAAEV